MLFLRIIRHLLPTGRAWRLVIDRLLRKFFEGLALGVPTLAKQALDDVSDDLRPATTRALPEWLDQFGVVPGSDEDTQRQQLTAAWLAKGGQSPRYIQDTLQAAGFDVYVHQWWVPGSDPLEVRDPHDYTDSPRIGSIQCGDSPEGICGDTDALCDDFLTNEVNYLVNKDLTPRVPPPLPTDPDRWRHFIYVGGETFGTNAVIDPDRQDEFERLVLQLRPTHAWVVLLTTNGAFVLSGFAVDTETGPEAEEWTATLEHTYATTFRSVAFGGVTTGVVVGYSGYIGRSTDDGDTWSTLYDGDHSTFGTNHGLGVVAGGDGTWVLVGGAGASPLKVMRSVDDGVTWSDATDALSAGISGIANLSDITLGAVTVTYGSGAYVIVAVTSGGRLVALSSVNGDTWTAYEILASITGNPSRVRFLNGGFVVLADDDGAGEWCALQSTDDGATWTQQLLGGGYGGGDVAYDSGTATYVLTGSGSGTTSGAIGTFRFSGEAATFIESLSTGLVAATTGLRSSVDGGITWTTVITPMPGAGTAGVASSVSIGDRLFFNDASTDNLYGVDIGTVNPAIAGVRTSMSFANSVGIAVGVATDGSVGFIARSTVAREWVDEYLSTLIPGLDDPLYSTVKNGLVAVAVGVDISDSSLLAIYSDDDGATWQRTATDLSALGVSVPAGFSPGVVSAYGGGKYVAAGCDGSGLFNVAVSDDDGATWTSYADPLSLGAGVTLYRLRYINGAFYALAALTDFSAAYVYRSTDGATWTSEALALSGYGIAFDIVELPDTSLLLVGAENVDSTPSVASWTSVAGTSWASAPPTGYSSGMVPFSVVVINGILYAASVPLGGSTSVHVSDDNGATWSPFADGISLEAETVFDLVYIEEELRLTGTRSAFFFSST